MADTNDYLREKRKSVLRGRMIRGASWEEGENEGESGLILVPGADTEELDKSLFRHHRKKLAGILLLAASLAVCGLVFWLYQGSKTFSGYSVLWQKSLEGGGMSDYTGFGAYILRYGRDGAICYDRAGETVWNQSFEMKKPIVDISGGYAVFADQQGYTMYICDASGCVGNVTTNWPITRVQVASQGVIAAILENTRSNQIVFYDRNGTELDIKLKTLIEEYGYPMDIGISPDGQQLAVAYIYMDAGSMMNKVVFYNFEVGKNRQDRVVGIFMEYQNAMVGEVTFLGNEYACAFADDRVDFYSLKNALSPELAQSVTYDGRNILSVFHSDSHVGVVVEGDGSDGTRQLYVYSRAGQELFVKPVAMAYSHAEFSGDYLLIYNDTNCLIYDMGGAQIYQGSLEGTISKCIAISRSRLFQVGGQVLTEIELK